MVIALGIRRDGREALTFEAAGEVLAVDPGLVVETGSGGVGISWN